MYGFLMVEKKYSKFAISSFLLAIFSLLFGVLAFLTAYRMFVTLLYIASILGVGFGITGLRDINKKNLKGKIYSSLGIILSIFIFLMMYSMYMNVR